MPLLTRPSPVFKSAQRTQGFRTADERTARPRSLGLGQGPWRGFRTAVPCASVCVTEPKQAHTALPLPVSPARPLLIAVCSSCLRPSSTPSSASASLFLLQRPRCPAHTHDAVCVHIHDTHAHVTHTPHIIYTHCTHIVHTVHTLHT